MRVPRYPIYVPSYNRWETCQTARFLIRDRCPFTLVVRAEQEEQYRSSFPDTPILTLPADIGEHGPGVVPTRRWIREHSIAAGHDRHWQLDDNMHRMYRMFRGDRMPCNSRIGFAVCEDFTDRYTNVGISGCNYHMFTPKGTPTPYWLNCHVYSITLINNRMTNLDGEPITWRGSYNEDTDLCLQALSAGWCTIQLNAFAVDKIATMIVRGGNTDEMYQGDGRTHMARELERRWPYVVTTNRRFGRAQHHIRGSWRGFDQQLQRRPDIDFDNLPPVDEYGMTLAPSKPSADHPDIDAILTDWRDTPPEQ